MADGWLDPSKYQHIRNTGATGPGTMYEGYSWRFVNHSTEGPPGSIASTINLFMAQPGSCPHFMIDPMGTGRRIQFIPWTWSACALRGGANGYQTNRGRAVQMEICGYAKDSPTWPDSALLVIADVIADVIKDGCPINPQNMPDDSTLRGTLATMNAPQRMSWGAWQGFDGVTAHVRVPNNDHWDVGSFNSRRLRELIVAVLDGSGSAPVSVVSSDTGPAADVRVGYLEVGMAGGLVTEVQELLAGLGYDVGATDGDFGPRTEAAVKAFQTASGLDVDGVVGPVTKAALSEAYAGISGKPPLPTPDPSAPAWPGRFLVLTNPMMSGQDVTDWQAQMHHRGWQLAVDGVFGRESFSVCKTFQAEKGLSVDGCVGPESWSAAFSAAIT